MKWIVYSLIILTLAACAKPSTQRPSISSAEKAMEAQKQQNLFVGNYLTNLQRLKRVAWPILTANADLCQEKTHLSGLLSWNAQAMADKNDWVETIRRLDGYEIHDDVISVWDIIPGSPAEIAGIQIGDTISHLDGEALPKGKQGFKMFLARMDQHTSSNTQAVRLGIVRDGQGQVIELTPVSACAFATVLNSTHEINAYADGNQIILTLGMMEFAQDDKNLALVISHELAHNNEKHIDSIKQNAMVGGLIGLFIDSAVSSVTGARSSTYSDLGAQSGALAYSADFEREADYIGLYYMARAGYPIEGVADFWRKMALRNEAAIKMTTSHPATAERYLAIDKTVAEIKSKLVKGMELVPQRR